MDPHVKERHGDNMGRGGGMVGRNKQYIGNRRPGRKTIPEKPLVKNKDRTQANRGRSFEEAIEATNEFYSIKGVAQIQKVSTPWQVVRHGAKIVSAFPKEKSTVDFIGSVGGLAVCFEAKETTGKEGRPETSFPLTIRKKEMITRHQFLFLQRWERTGGIAFVLIHFKNRDECFAVPVDWIGSWYVEMNRGGRKSIPYAEFNQEWKVNINDYLGLFKN